MIVLIKENNQPSLKWSLGKIIETHPGADGIVRAVTLKTEKGTLKRPVRKLAPLPTQDNSTKNTKS